MVQYRCKHCQSHHPLLLPFAEKLYFDAAATLDIELECPDTRARAEYNKTDLVWTDLHEAVP